MNTTQRRVFLASSFGAGCTAIAVTMPFGAALFFCAVAFGVLLVLRSRRPRQS